MSEDSTFVDKSIVRIDKSISSIKMFSIYKENAALIRDIIIFLARGYQQDLFNYTIFDPHEFYKLLKWNRTTLGRVVISTEIDPEYPEINDGIGLALVQLLRAHIEVPIEEQIDKWGSWGRGIRKVVIIEEIIPMVGKHKKKLYKLKISDSFKENLNKFYFPINFDTYAKLKSKNTNSLQELYLFGMTLKNKLLNTESIKDRIANGDSVIESTQSFKKLADIAQISLSEARFIKQALIKAFNKLNTEDPTFKITLVFTKTAKANYAYTPVLQFILNSNTVNVKSNRVQILNNALVDRLIEMYRIKNNIHDIFTTLQEEQFEKWTLSSNSQMVKIRAEVFAEVYSSMMPYKIEKNHKFATNFGATSQILLSYDEVNTK